MERREVFKNLLAAPLLAGEAAAETPEPGPRRVMESLFHRDGHPMEMAVDFQNIGLPGSADARDLWAHKGLGTLNREFTTKAPRHGAVLIKVMPKQ